MAGKLERLSKVKEGSRVRWKTYLGPQGGKAKPACADKGGGRWVCVTHGTLFDNQFQKDTHIHDERRAHVLAWLCSEHGPEVP